MRSLLLLSPFELIWTVIGVILTVIATLIHLPYPEFLPWIGGYQFSLQVAGVLLTACLGGAGAGVYAQVAYLALGLFESQVFSYGGGLEYIHRAAFGYLLGFLPAGWVCGTLAFRQVRSRGTSRSKTSRSPSTQLAPRLSSPSPVASTQTSPSIAPVSLSSLVWACLAGLICIHLTGVTYLIFQTQSWVELGQEIGRYTGFLLPGQLLVICGTALVAWICRYLLLY